MTEERFTRNIPAISEQEQRKLQCSRVFIAGCGGLGGAVFAHLLRMGVGEISVADADSFEESNLNRQLLCTSSNLGESKVKAALKYAKDVSPDTKVNVFQTMLNAENCPDLVAGHDAVIDALDSFASRRVLAAACAAKGLPLVYGAVSAWCAQVSVLQPQNAVKVSSVLNPEGMGEQSVACLSSTAGICAAIQAAECVKLLLGKASRLDGSLLLLDTLHDDAQYISLL